MTEALLTTLSMENPSTLLSMDSGRAAEGESRAVALCRPPDINLPLSVEMASSSAAWLSDVLEVGLSQPSGTLDLDCLVAAKCPRRPSSRREDIIWGAWFFFNHYFRPAVTEKCKSKLNVEEVTADCLLDKSDLRLDLFLVQYDMENMYAWAFKERPENALGKVQLRSYMNGSVDRSFPFPFGSERGFFRSHRMQRKRYRGLSNPQCIHGVEAVRCPTFAGASDEDKCRWSELTGRDLSLLALPAETEVFATWRAPPCTDFDFDLDLDRGGPPPQLQRRQRQRTSIGKLSDTMLDLSTKLPPSSNDSPKKATMELPSCHKKKRTTEVSPGSSQDGFGSGTPPPLDLDLDSSVEPPPWLPDFTGVMADASTGPVTCAKTVYEDDKGYLIVVSLPFTDIPRARVSWLNTASHGLVKIHCTSTARAPYVKRGERTFKLTDPWPEHCPPGEFVREIALPARIPDNAELKAFYVEAGAGLEISVPKHPAFSKEREVRVFLPPQLGHNESSLV